MPSTASDQTTRLLAMFGSILVIAGCYLPCVELDPPLVFGPKPPVQTLVSAEPFAAIGVLAMTALVCVGTFGKSRARVPLTWLFAILLLAAIAGAGFYLRHNLTRVAAQVNANTGATASFRLLWGWAVLGAGGLVQLVTAVWATRSAARTKSADVEVAPPAEAPAAS